MRSSFTQDVFCEQVVSADGQKAYVVAVNGLYKVNLPIGKIMLKGLDADGLYFVEECGKTFSGAELMYIGLQPEFSADFTANVWHIASVNK